MQKLSKLRNLFPISAIPRLLVRVVAFFPHAVDDTPSLIFAVISALLTRNLNSKVFENSSKQNMMKPKTNLVDRAAA